MKILLSAAETSSDLHGAALLKALKEVLPPEDARKLRVFGIGGPALQAQGLEAWVDARELLVMGFTEVLGRLPRILGILKRVSTRAARERPDIAVLIDYPDFHFRLARRLREQGVPVVYYIPPKVWVWRKKRVELLRERFVRLLCIFPFEEDFYRRAGVRASFVGNPLVDELPLAVSRAEARTRLGLLESMRERIVVVMPGSRPAELKRHLEPMLRGAERAAAHLGIRLRVLVPLPSPEDLTRVRGTVSAEGLDNLSGVGLRLSHGDAHLCMIAADAGLVKSGTSTLEAGILGCPHAVVYRPSALSGWIFRTFVGYQGAVGLVNLVAGSDKLPYLAREILMNSVTPENLGEELASLLSDSQRRSEIQAGLKALREKVMAPVEGESSPSRAAAKVLLETLREAGRSGESSSRPETAASPIVAPVIALASSLWSGLTSLARTAQERGWTSASCRLDARVISVGNLQAGGTGKTPLVARIAREAAERGLNVAILTRGYHSRWEREGGTLLPGEMAPAASICGDEVALLRELAPEASLAVGADRLTQYETLKRRSKAAYDLVILDDGFQNRRIRKDVEVVAVTSARPGSRLFRDRPAALRFADLVVWTKGEIRPDVSAFPGRRLVRVRYRLSSPQSSSLQCLFLVTGVGDPQSVVDHVAAAGYSIVKHQIFPDHAEYGREQVRALLDRARSAGAALALTGKDWVKWKDLGVSRSEVIVLEPELVFEEGKDFWNQILWGELSSSS